MRRSSSPRDSQELHLFLFTFVCCQHQRSRLTTLNEKKCFQDAFAIYLDINKSEKPPDVSIFERFFHVRVFPVPVFIAIFRFRVVLG